MASTLTCVLTLVFAAPAREDATSNAKIARQAAPIVIASANAEETRASELIENFALAHVRRTAPEAFTVEPETPRMTPRPIVSASKPRLAATPAPTMPSTAVATPPRRPVELAHETAEPPAPAPPAFNKPEGFRIPVVSDVADNIARKIPSGRDILDGVGNVSKKIGSIFGRG